MILYTYDLYYDSTMRSEHEDTTTMAMLLDRNIIIFAYMHNIYMFMTLCSVHRCRLEFIV